jgi:hypothetical protein
MNTSPNSDPAVRCNVLLADAIRLLESAPLEQYARWKKYSVADKIGRKCMDQVSVWANKLAELINRARSNDKLTDRKLT